MKAKLESVVSDRESSFKILLTPNLNELFYWHFHPEYEIVYVEAVSGFRHIGNHISKYEGSDLAFIGPNIPHLNFDYGVKEKVNTVVIQMKENFLGEVFLALPEIEPIANLFERAKHGLTFSGETKWLVSQKMRNIATLPHFEQLITLLEVLNLLAKSTDVEALEVKPISGVSVLKEQQRLQKIHHYIEVNYQQEIDVNEVANLCNLTTAAFCRYFKKATHYTFTDFLNHFRINQSKNLLLQHKNVTEACYESGFSNLSYFNKIFKKVTGENPSAFKKRNSLA
jgi:AraC-like DNA-binding protein